MKYIVIIFTLFFSLFFLSSNNDAYGLSCEQPDMKRHFAESDVVFSGKAISQEYFPSEYGFANGRNDTKTQFQVIESFKGDNKKIMNVTSSEWFWGYDFNKGLEYVVFAYYDDNNDLRHQTCTSTSLLKDADIVKIRQASSFAESFSITEKQVRYNIPYKITNGIIDDVTLSCDDGSLLLQVTAQDESDVTLILDLPRNILDPKINGRDDRFIVLGDGQEIYYEEMPYTKHRKLSMSFYSDTNEIEIIHSFIPELKPKMCEVIHDPPYSYMLPPLIQFNSEIPFNEIQCKQNLVLIQKYDGSPACVTESTKTKLVERGWTATKITKPVSNSYNPYESRCGSGAIPYIPKNWHEIEKQPSGEKWENLGRHLMKEEFYKQLKQQNIIFEPACFGIYKGSVEWSYPPIISMCTVVSELDGDKIYLEGTVHKFDVINFEMTRTIPYQCDKLSADCFCNIENEN